MAIQAGPLQGRIACWKATTGGRGSAPCSPTSPFHLPPPSCTHPNPRYFPVYLIPALFVHRQRLLDPRVAPELWRRLVLGMLRSSAFLTLFCVLAWRSVCLGESLCARLEGAGQARHPCMPAVVHSVSPLMTSLPFHDGSSIAPAHLPKSKPCSLAVHNVAGRTTGPLFMLACGAGGLSLLAEKKSRRMDIALYCLSRVRRAPRPVCGLGNRPGDGCVGVANSDVAWRCLPHVLHYVCCQIRAPIC